MASRNIRIPQIVRYRVVGNLKDAQIASLVGMTPAGLSQLLMSQEYKDAEQAYLLGHVSKMDEAAAGKIDVIRNEARVGVPVALRTIIEVATQRKDLKAALEASKELLDRDPDRTLAKSKEGAGAVPSVPAEVLQAAVDVGNTVAKSYDPKAGVN